MVNGGVPDVVSALSGGAGPRTGERGVGGGRGAPCPWVEVRYP